MSAWLTKLTLDPRLRPIRALIDDASRQHRWLMNLAPDGLGDQPRRQAGLLYRIEESKNGTNVLVQTTTEPLLERLPTEGVRAAQTRNLASLLDALERGMTVRYRIVANPTKRWGNSAPKKDQIGKLHVLHGPAAQQWWRGRAAACGLDVGTVEWLPQPDARARGRGSHARARFDGLATVTDLDALRGALLEGVGRSRSYGCGLLSLAIHDGSPVGERP